MVPSSTATRSADPIRQFSLFADNKVGRLHELVQQLNARKIHILAFSQVDATECTVMRFIVDYPEDFAQWLHEQGHTFAETEVVAVEIETPAFFSRITASLIEAEININYVYAFLSRPYGRAALALSLEDNDLATNVLRAHGLTVLDQNDLAR